MKFKTICAAALVFFTACCFAGCGEGGGGLNDDKDNDAQDKFPYWQVESERERTKQYYKQEGIEFPDSLWETPSAERYEALDKNNVRAYFVTSVEGEQVFCFVGLPESASRDNPVPAVVCVHGATGTAFYDWVELWNKKGYAAIAMDTEGKMPTGETSLYHALPSVETGKPHGPANSGFHDSNKPVTDQWVYHALGAVISCTSFISSFEEVDSSRIGITGVSYGGFLTCLAAGFDDRFVFAAPVYGCLANSGSDAEFGEYIDGNEGAEIWDGVGALSASNSVFLFVNGNVDHHFPLDSTKKSAEACKQSAVCIKNKLTHGHSQGAEVNEVFVFADEICKNGKPLVHITEVDAQNGELAYALPDGVTVASARQYYTADTQLNDTTQWKQETVDFEEGYVFYSVEASKTHWYIEIEDGRGLIASCTVRSKA